MDAHKIHGIYRGVSVRSGLTGKLALWKTSHSQTFFKHALDLAGCVKIGYDTKRYITLGLSRGGKKERIYQSCS